MKFLAVILNSFMLVACGGGGGGTPAAVVPANAAPVANAGFTQNAAVGSTITLDGSASSDANGDPLAYAWTLTNKPPSSAAVLSSTTFAKPTFTADVAGDYVASLIVNDGKVNSATVNVAVNVATIVPTTPAGVSITSITSNSVTISWNASANVAGGVIEYRVNGAGSGADYGNGVPYDPRSTSFTDRNLDPSTSVSYSVSACPSGDYQKCSAPSTVMTATTLDFAPMKAKFTAFISFNKVTGKVVHQAFASPGLIAKVSMPPADYDVIEHAAIDATLYGIKSVGIRQYAIVNLATSIAVEPIISGLSLNQPGAPSVVLVQIDKTTGRRRVTQSAINEGSGSLILLYDIADGDYAYLAGEIL